VNPTRNGHPVGPPEVARRTAVGDAIKRMLAVESRLSIPPADIADDEPLNGDLLTVNSLGFLGILVRLEDELDVALPDDLFAGRSFDTVADVIDLVLHAVEGQP
jgi:acyl carrier protein